MPASRGSRVPASPSASESPSGPVDGSPSRGVIRSSPAASSTSITRPRGSRSRVSVSRSMRVGRSSTTTSAPQLYRPSSSRCRSSYSMRAMSSRGLRIMLRTLAMCSGRRLKNSPLKKRPFRRATPTSSTPGQRKPSSVRRAAVTASRRLKTSTGTRAASGVGKWALSTMEGTSIGSPWAGTRCMNTPGPALISMIAQGLSDHGRVMSSASRSMPRTWTSRNLATSSASFTLSGWMTSVTLTDTPPCEMLATRRRTSSSPGASTSRREPPLSRTNCTRMSSISILPMGERGVPAYVLGDREHTVEELNALENARPERDQLLHGVLAVAHHVGRHALQRRHEPPADREQAVVGARDLLLDDHAVIGALRRLDGELEAHPEVPLRRDAGGHALALVPGDRLGDDRESEPRGSVPGLVQLEDDLATRHRQAEVVEEGLGAVLVRGELGVLDAVAAQYRGAATELLAAVAPLDHVLALEVEGGQPGAVARLEDGVDGGAAEAAAHEAAQHLSVARLEVERAAVVLVAQPVGDELDAAPANVRVDVLHGDGGNAVAVQY